MPFSEERQTILIQLPPESVSFSLDYFGNKSHAVASSFIQMFFYKFNKPADLGPVVQS